jgi:plasmid maintenance system antidote protein VapI
MAAKRNAHRSITNAIKSAIADSKLSFNALERETGVKRQSLMKFMADEQSLRLDLADKLAAYFGLVVIRKVK